jgi:hypothetical protein
MSNIYGQEREVRLRLNDALVKYNIKQIDIARDTGMLMKLTIIRNSPLNTISMASRKTSREQYKN